MSHYLLLLAVVPLSCFYLTSTYKPKWKWTLTGVLSGMVVAPVSLALLQYVHVPLIGKLLGLAGLLFNLIHGSLGYFVVVGLGLQQPGVVLSTSELLSINLINGLIWATYYGMVGYHYDVKGAEAEGAALAEYRKRAVS